MKVTNITNGPKGVNTPEGPLEIASGETIDVEMTDAEVKSSTRMGWFEFSGSPSDADDADKLDRDELKKQAAELGIEYAPNITTPKLKELIDAKLAE